jgi:hypothetical protein
MAECYVDRIRRYCEANGIAIPIGFRDAAQRYAVIDLSGPPKLLARTWFNQADVVYYLERLAGEGPRRILDFKEGVELHYVGRSRLRRGERFL